MAALEVRVPDIGDFSDIPVIEVLVRSGDSIAKDAALVTLESDKATMEVPSPAAGIVGTISVRIGDKVSKGTPILTLDAQEAAAPAAETMRRSADTSPVAAPGGESAIPQPGANESSGRASSDEPTSPAAPATNDHAGPESHPIAPPERVDEEGFRKAHASPAVRKFARELGVDLSRVTGTGPKGRIVVEDVQEYVKRALGGGAIDTSQEQGPTLPRPAIGALDLLPWPLIDFAKFGAIVVKPLSRIKKISGANLHRNWVMIPHVTQHDDADITGLEAFRVAQNRENEKSGVKVTMLAFLIAAAVAALKKYPDFNASLDGENLVHKRYFHIGFAADTPNGLVVPVIRDADRKGVLAIATEMAALSAKAREGKLGPADMQGGSFSISSLGGIGGTYFTPIINAPEVAILGVSRAQTKPVWNGSAFVPRLMLPLSLSYDHRVIDGAAAARFTGFLAAMLADLRRIIL
jgi:pyruvate dehydrogenase E2 component (dihydrolipoamide acetyltransferase)